MNEGHAGRIRVLLYHRVVEDRALARRNRLCVHVDDFYRQLELLRAWGFNTVTFEDCRRAARGEIRLPRKPVVLTFDDAYHDVYVNVFFMLQRFGMKGVVFAVGDRRVTESWWDEGSRYIPARLMDDDQLRDMHSVGFEIGSHSMSHRRLTALEPSAVFGDLIRSKASLESVLDTPIGSFAYPYGEVNPMVKRQAMKAGYTSACAVFSGPLCFASDPFEIRRINMPSRVTTMGFEARVHTRLFEWNSIGRQAVRKTCRWFVTPQPRQHRSRGRSETLTPTLATHR